MGTIIELNDTLQITREQGFPSEIDLERHLQTPYMAQDFEGKVFEFRNKNSIRVYHTPPVRNFLVENRDGKWIYWGLAHVFDVIHHEDGITSGKFRIMYLYTPEEMRKAHEMIDRNPKTRFDI